MEQHLQDVAQNGMHDKNSDYFDDPFAKHFIQKLIPQQCHEIMYFKILFTVNHIG